MRRLVTLLLVATFGLQACAAPLTPPSESVESSQPVLEDGMELTQETAQSDALTDTVQRTVTLEYSPAENPEVPLQQVAAVSPGFEKMIATGLGKRWKGKQAIVVRADGANSATARVWLYEYKNKAWRVAAGPWTAVVGKKGIGKTGEGDGRSPSGAFLLGTAFGWARKPTKMDYQYRKVDSKDLWVDEAGPYYNRWVRGSSKIYGSGEKLKSVKQYEYAIAVHYNDSAKKNAGSAIFLHIWKGKGQGTAGCTAMSRTNILKLLRWLDYDKRPILVQGTEAQLKTLMAKDWGIEPLPKNWGYVDDFIPDIVPDLRYYTKNNFTGKKIKGYGAPAAPMRIEAIQSLSNVADALRKEGLALRVYDAYRPQVATNAMLSWARDEADTATKAKYYPGIDKKDIPGVYVAKNSKHRLGGTIDVTLHRWSTGKDLSMGGRFNFFGTKSHYSYKKLTPTQKANRKKLRTVMMKQSFAPYSKEWWHFTDKVGGNGGTFLIKPREYSLK